MVTVSITMTTIPKSLPCRKSGEQPDSAQRQEDLQGAPALPDGLRSARNEGMDPPNSSLGCRVWEGMDFLN